MTGAHYIQWLWGESAAARVARLPLVPLAGAYWAAMRVRAARAGRAGVARLPLPTIAVGNVSVGGTGKTPVAAWIAEYCLARGWTPGILLRGYGGDESLVHRRLVPGAIVVANPDRVAGAAAARAAGARVLVLDDAYQLLSVARDRNIALLSAESAGGSRWPLPAGPWREGWDALSRADLIVVTRKRVAAAQAEWLADRLARRWPGVPVAVAWLAIERLAGLQSGATYELARLAGRDVVAAAGIADPATFAAQLAAAGARVQLMAFQDHHAYRPSDVQRLVQAAAGGGYVVVTEKDAVKLRGVGRWNGPEPLVAELGVRWERNGRAVEQALDAVLAPAPRP